MLNILNKIKSFHPLKGKGSSLSVLPYTLNKTQPQLKFPFATLKNQTPAAENNTEVPDVLETSIPFEDLIEKRVDLKELIDLDKQREELIQLFRETQMSPEETVQLKQQRLEEKYQSFAPDMINRRFMIEVDALKSHKIYRPFSFTYQNSLDNYNFRDGNDYHVLQRTDEYHALSRLSYVDMSNSFIQNKLKHLLNPKEHFSKFAGEYETEVSIPFFALTN